MKAGEKLSGLVANLHAAANAALKRLAGAGEATPTAAADPAFSIPPDPTVGLFGAADADDEIVGNLPLSMQLEDSARSIIRRADDLRDGADRLVARIAERAAAEVTLAVQAARVLIGLGWLGVAAWLYNGALAAAAADAAVLHNGMPIGDALVLSRTFLFVAAAALGVAFLVGAFVAATGKGDNDRIRREAETLGTSIADTSREFGDALTQYRAAMDRRGDAADAVSDLSRAHLTALEACAFFRDVAFMTGAEGEEARRLFRGFLRRPATPPPALAVFLIGLIAGGFIGAAYIYMNYVPKPPPAAPATTLAIAAYPWAVNLLLFGGLVYVGVGFALSLFSDAIAAGATAKARDAALDALRGAFTAREAPRPADIAQRIQDAVDVFRARVGGRRLGAGAAQTNHPRGANGDSAADGGDIPHWRRRDSSVKFVETEFSAAPARWRTDAYAKKLSGEPASKRELPGGKKRNDR